MDTLNRWQRSHTRAHVMTGGDMMVMSWSLVLGDPVYLAYFKEFLRLNEQRLITLHRVVGCLKGHTLF